MASKRSKYANSGEANNHVQKTEDSSRNEDASTEPNTDPDMFCGVHRSILEAFDNLNWRDNMSHGENESFSRHWIPPEEKSASHAMKLIDSEMARFLTKGIKLPPWPKNEGKLSFYLPGLKPNHQTMLPKHSVLNRKEQYQLYVFYCRMTLKKSCPLNEQELAKFQELRSKVAEEYAEFQEFAKSEWYRGQWKRALQISPQVEQFVDSLWKMRAGQCLTAYPDEYKSVKQIPLALHDPNEDFSVFEFVKQVHIQSWPLKMSLPKIKEPINLISDFEDLTRIKPVSADFQNRPRPLTKLNSSVSFDNIVEKLLKRADLDIDVVISMSGIKTLVDNVKFQREWVLPITVKDVLKDDGETRKRVVIIDKNLPPKCMSVHEKNLWHAKIVAKWMLVLNSCPNLFAKKEESPHLKGTRDGESYEDMLSEVVQKLHMDRSAEKRPQPPDPEPSHSKPKARPSFGNNLEARGTRDGESYEDMLSEVVQKLHMGRSAEKRPQPPDPEPSHSKPKARPSFGNNLEARAKGERELTSYNDLPSDVKKLNVDGSRMNVGGKAKQPVKSPEPLVNTQQLKNKPSLVSKNQWASFSKPKDITLQGKSTVKHRIQERQSLISYDDPFTDFAVQDFEEFGVDPTPPRHVKSRDLKPKETASCNISIEGSPVTKVKSPKREGSSGCMRTNTPIEEGEIPIEEGEIPSLGRVLLKPSDARKDMHKQCQHYQIWNLHKSRYIQFLKLEQRRLNVLVRTRNDGKLFHYRDNIRLQDDVCVSSKLEFQPEFGASKMAASELTREYLDLHMRPDSKLVRVRAIGHTKELMMTEVKSISEIKTALQVEGRQIQKLFDPLYAVLTKLIDLLPGRYMLQHTAKMGPFATLLLEAPGRTSFNLPHYCQELTPVEVNVPPMPIDPLVLSPLQHRDHVAPALFIPGFNPESVSASHSTYFSKPKSNIVRKAKKSKYKKKRPKKSPLKDEESLNQFADSVDSLGLDNLLASQ